MVVTYTDLIRTAKSRNQLKAVMKKIIHDANFQVSSKPKAVRTVLLSEAKLKLYNLYRKDISDAKTQEELLSIVRELTADDLVGNKTKLIALAKLKSKK